MTQVVLTTTGAGTWSVPANCPVGSSVLVETWGAGSGGTGRVSTTFGAAGAAGAYASSHYIITPNDIASGVGYAVGAGTAGLSGANPAAGGNTIWSLNNNMLPNTTNVGAVVATNTSPTGIIVSAGVGITPTLIGFGTDPVTGYAYFDYNFSGTSADGSSSSITFVSSVTALPSTTYCISGYWSIVGGANTNVTCFLELASTLNGSFVASLAGPVIPTLTPTSVQTYGSGALPASGVNGVTAYMLIQQPSGSTINITIRTAALQLEQASTPTFWESTPGYTLAVGGGAPSGTTGGVGGAAASCVGSIAAFSGGSGAAYSAAGSGGGGSAGAAGNGATGTTAGVGGTADNGSGGAGGAVSITSPGNAGTANVEGGGGGGGLTAVGGTGGAGAAPGGAGGGAAVATGTGGTGARGQIRLTYTPVLTYPYQPQYQMAPLLAQ